MIRFYSGSFLPKSEPCNLLWNADIPVYHCPFGCVVAFMFSDFQNQMLRNKFPFDVQVIVPIQRILLKKNGRYWKKKQRFRKLIDI